MTKLSIVIPSRDEKFLTPTIDDIFRNCRDEQTEVIAVLDSDRWPGDWKEVTARHPRLHTIHNGSPIGMRGSINKGAASAISRGAKFIAKFDGHCSFSEGFDVALMADCDEDWIVVPRRGRLDPESWTATDIHKPDIDYHYLSFPDDPNDFGGPGLNGKPWNERAIERKDIVIDDEMSSQGSGWFMHATYFTRLGLMDEASYGPFWNEFQELGMKAWLSGGAVKVNKKCKYLHLHKGSKHGRGYKLPESWLKLGRDHTMKWIWNEAWDKQTRPFKWLIEHFWPVPTWSENWEGVLYATRKPRLVSGMGDTGAAVSDGAGVDGGLDTAGLTIHSAHYGIGSPDDIDVRERLQSLVSNNSLDIVVNNSTLTPNQNPYRGQKKYLRLDYSMDGGGVITRRVEEKDWLIIGPVEPSGIAPIGEKHEAPQFEALMKVLANEGKQSLPYVSGTLSSEDTAKLLSKHGSEGDAQPTGFTEKICPFCGREQRVFQDGTFAVHAKSIEAELREVNPVSCQGSGKKWESNLKDPATGPLVTSLSRLPPMTATALNDYLIRKFSISPQRLRGPMPIELRDFHRNDLAQLFAELGFKRGAEIGVAEGNYSEILLKANPECELLLVDPWHHYSENPQGKSPDKHAFAFNETTRKTKDYKGAKMIASYSMDAVRDVDDNSLDFCYIDAHHSYPYVMCDIIEWTKKVRSGGIVALDDVYRLNEARWGAGPMEAIYDYTRAMRINPWWLISAHKSVDAFFVKP